MSGNKVFKKHENFVEVAVLFSGMRQRKMLALNILVVYLMVLRRYLANT